MNRLLVIFSILAAFSAGAQTSEKYNSKYAAFFRAEELFEKEQYGSARKEFRGFVDQFGQKNDPMYIKALYYEGVSALELFNNDGVTLLEDFNRNYPESIYKTRIYYKLGRYYYQKKDYKEALSWFNRLSAFDVEADDKDEFYFKLGYANFQEGNYPAARTAFYEVKDATSQYGPPSLYYYSHIAYSEKSYQTALEGFEKLLSDKRFKEVVPYYITQIYYLQGRYADVTHFAPALIDSVKTSSVSSMNHLIGDAFYRVGKYDEAVLYLEQYNKKEHTTRQEDYQLGYAYYRSSNYDNAIRLFDRVSKVKDTLGQTAFYHIGECYLKKGQIAYARTAFEAAAVMENMDAKIQEDALYNYAILSYKLDINPYDEAVEALQLYLRKYPNSDRKNEVYQYLVNVYTSTNKYADALKSLDKMATKDIRLKTAYQIVAFNHGVELFQKSEYTKAIEAFALVEKYPVDAAISAKAKFWSADAYYYLGSSSANGKASLQKAIQGYRSFINSPGNYSSNLRADAYYNLGYAYLNTAENPAQNPQLEESFKNFLSQPNLKKAKKADAYMRLADYYYISKKNDLAIRNYKEAYELKSGNEDQALYFMALTYGLSERGQDDKIRSMQDIINNYPRSQYMLPSIYEVGMAYRAKEQDDKALPYYQQILKDYPKSNLVSEALLNIADIYYKKKDFARSETMYRKALSDYGTDRETCASAVSGLKNIYKSRKEFDKIQELSIYKCADDVLDDLEETYYQAGIEPYMDSSFTEAIPDLEKYLQKYPEGKYGLEISAYLANAYYRTNKLEKAYDIYRVLLEKPNTAFTELAAIRMARDRYNNGDYENALIYYTKLEQVTSRPATIYNTQIGLMRCHFLLENWANAAEYAKKVLASSSGTAAQAQGNSIRLEAEYVKGVSFYHEESYAEAKPSLEWVVKNTTTEFAPECKFYLAEMSYKQKDNVKAEAEIRALLKMKPAYDFWTAKALILQSKVLIAKNDLFQAEHTLRSVIDNYKEEDDGILLEANQLWDELMQLKSVPKTVPEKQKTEIEINEKRK